MEKNKVFLYSVTVAILLGFAALSLGATGQTEAAPSVLSFITWRGDDSEAYDLIIAAFQEKYPNIKVNVEYFKGGTMYDGIVSTRGIGGELDIYAAQPGGQLSAYVESNYAMDLTGQPFIDRVIPGAVTAGTIGGKTYGVSQATATMCVFYNTRMFKERGLSVPDTAEQFLEICDMFKAEGIDPLVAGLAQPYIAQNHFKMMASHMDPEGAPYLWIKVSDGEMTLRDEPYPTLLRAIKLLYDRGYYVKGVEGIDKHGAAAVFAQQKAAMDIEGTWRAGTIAGTEGAPDFDIFGIPFHGDPKVKVSVVHPNQSHLIFPKSKNKDAALKFYDHMMTKEMMEIYSTMTGQVPTVKGTPIEAPTIRLISEFIGSARPVLGPNLANPNTEVQQTLYETFTRVAIGHDVDTVIKEMQEKIDAIER